MPSKGFVDPITSDETEFHLNIPVSELIKCVTQAIEASVVSSAPLVVEIADRVTHEIRPTPTEPYWAWGLKPPNPRSRDRGSKAGPRRARCYLASNKSQGRKHR